MDTVTIDGVEYVKAMVLAKKLKYTADYIGQLCRGHKVDAHLVGRTWYVYPPSLDSHKSTRYSELRSNEKIASKAIKVTSSRLDVPAPLAKSMVRSVAPHFTHRVNHRVAAYESDTSNLLPDLVKEVSEAPFRMKVNLADSEKVKVASSSKNFSMVSQPLPAIALSGTLKVQSFESKYVFAHETTAVDTAVEQNAAIAKESVDPIDEIVPEVRELRMKKVVGSSAKVQIHRLETHITPVHTENYVKKAYKSVGSTAVVPKGVAPSMQEVKTTRVPSNVPQLKIATTPVPAASGHESSLFFRLVVAPLLIACVLLSALALVAVENIVTVTTNGERAVSWRLSASVINSFLGTEL